MGSSYVVPWVSMEAGKTAQIEASPKAKASAKKGAFEGVDFYCYFDSVCIKLDAKADGDKYTLTVFGGEANASYNIYAMKDGNTLGCAKVFSTKHKEFKVKLIPVVYNVELSEKFVDSLNIIFAPLGKRFSVEKAKVFTDEDIKAGVAGFMPRTYSVGYLFGGEQ